MLSPKNCRHDLPVAGTAAAAMGWNTGPVSARFGGDHGEIKFDELAVTESVIV